MTSNQIIKELLARMYVTRPSLDAINSTKELSGPLSENFAEDFAPSNEWLSSALGGEAKVLWDMVNESPYTPLETELLQRLQMTYNKVYDLGTGDGQLVYRACFAPSEEAWLEPLQVWFKDGPPWMTPGGAEEWAENKDYF